MCVCVLEMTRKTLDEVSLVVSLVFLVLKISVDAVVCDFVCMCVFCFVLVFCFVCCCFLIVRFGLTLGVSPLGIFFYFTLTLTLTS